MMQLSIQDQLIAGLFLWALVSLGTATVGLYSRPRDLWRHFWFMSGVWGLIDGLIAWFAALGEPRAPWDLLPILKLNTGLDVLYIGVGLILFSRANPRLRGFGLAVIVQGAFLFAFDGYYWWRCAELVA